MLSPEEVARLLGAPTCLKHQAALSVAYGAGLRAAEVAALKVRDIDSERMLLRVERGKPVLSNCVHAVRYSVLFLTIALRVTSSFRIVATMASLKGFPASRRRLVVAASCPLSERAMLSAAR